MRKAGGIIALIAGIFGVLAAIATLLIGGVGAGIEAANASTIISLGWGGLIFSFLTIILGSFALAIQGKVIGMLIMSNAIAGAILGGTFVAVTMVLAFSGGLIIVLGRTNSTASAG